MRKVLSLLLLTVFLTPIAAQSQQAVSLAEPAKLFRSVAPSVVTIVVEAKSERRQGSGVAVGSSYDDKHKVSGTWIVTNAHVVAGNRAEVKIAESGRTWPAKIEYRDAPTDLAILHVQGLILPVLKPYGTKSLEIGSRVFAVGTPLSLDRSLSEGLVSGIRQDRGITLVQTTAAISRGSSGGALIDDQARLVGVTTFKISEGESLNFAVDASRIADIRAALEAARLFQAVYLRRAVRVGSEEDRDVLYIESDALTKWMLETRRPDGSPTYSWFSSRILASMETKNPFWGGNPEFEAFQAEFLATRPSGSTAQGVVDTAGVVRLTCKMNATRDGTFQFDLAVAFDIAKGTVNGLPANVTSDEIIFRTGKDASFTAFINRFSLQSRIGNEERPNLLSGTCVKNDERKF